VEMSKMDKRLERLIKKTIDDSARYKNIKEILVTEEFKKPDGLALWMNADVLNLI
jgi:hypothetical protein